MILTCWDCPQSSTATCQRDGGGGGQLSSVHFFSAHAAGRTAFGRHGGRPLLLGQGLVALLVTSQPSQSPQGASTEGPERAASGPHQHPLSTDDDGFRCCSCSRILRAACSVSTAPPHVNEAPLSSLSTPPSASVRGAARFLGSQPVAHAHNKRRHPSICDKRTARPRASEAAIGPSMMISSAQSVSVSAGRSVGCACDLIRLFPTVPVRSRGFVAPQMRLHVIILCIGYALR